MSSTPEQGKVKQLAGGWITEREGTPVPLFLKLTYVGFSLFGIAYLFLYRMGEEGHATRGPLVKQANEVMGGPPSAWMAVLGVCLAGFAALLLWYAFRKEDADE